MSLANLLLILIPYIAAHCQSPQIHNSVDVQEVYRFSPWCSHSLTTCGVNGPQKKERDTRCSQQVGSQESSARFKCVLLGGMLITLHTERNVGIAPGLYEDITGAELKNYNRK